MPRRVEDILPNEHRSIREIPVRSGKMKITKVIEEPEHAPLILETKKKSHRGTSGKRYGFLQKSLIIIGCVVVLTIIGYFASAYFSRAVFTITPKTVSISVNSSYVASNTPKGELLGYKIVKIERSASTTVPAIDGPSLTAKAQGTLNILNAYSPTSRRLIAGTRFSSPSGKIYKLSSSIMIPGYKTSVTGAIIPGSIKSLVVADQPGADYNVEKTNTVKTFTIVAYEGGDKFDKIYGELATTIKGGASGNKKIIDPAIQASTTAALKSKLLSELSTALNEEVSDNSFMFDKNFVNFESEVSNSSTNQANIIVRGTIYGFLFSKLELVTKLAGQPIVDSFGGYSFEPVGLNEMSFTLSNEKDFSPSKGGAMIMQLKGTLTLTGKIPVKDLKDKFAGLSLSDTAQILRTYSPIIDLTKSSGQVVPPWAKVPTNEEKISIIIQ